MVKKSSVFFAVTAGIAAYVVTKKVLQNQENVKNKLQELKEDGTEAGVRYYQYAREFFNDETFKPSFEGFKQKVVDTASDLKNNEKINQAFASLKTATADLRSELTEQKRAAEGENSAEKTKSTEDEIVIDGRSAFGQAKAAADFEEDHPTETFFPHGE
ncbi:MAG: hypothetical protein ABF483_09760 [Liquorilactobacillus nagelii]|jgi:predicted nucleotide-binding protein (sugar kinase/HSP70/actin superfamily)|uniref:YtxH domain-containing protein n=1 Tax=Liquorilactobacillus nagelii TaxID=82688 RepID=A0A3Q8CZP6_9LACO|nr:hypothetical protein [Liquorilactobacillus nagelii]AUJ32556.1 hypothetical protein BSQ50_08430 [Liquorilactobacillus nagelii]MCC7616704.1 hypothetical protein [Liquorilactobacillus nagelii]MCP9315895.1 hypothetical protein [Liquorilactobacillus nagelii]